jgi:hypothetical protein
MVLPWVADVGDSLQIWRIAANILNNSCRQPTRGGPQAWGLRKGLTTPHYKNQLLQNVTQDLGIRQILQNNTYNGK